MAYPHLKALRESLSLSQKDFAKSIGMKQTTYNGYETGAREPKSDLWVAISEKYGVTVDYLMGLSNDPHKTSAAEKNAPSLSDEALRLARDYDYLDDHGQDMLRVVADRERIRMDKDANKLAEPREKIIPLFGPSFAAGPGEPDFGNAWEEYRVDAGSRADFAIRITGDSMEPYLHDGQIALGIRRQPQDGEVGAFNLDGEFLCKQVCSDIRGTIYLFSLNRARSDADVTIERDSGRSLTYFGTIIMDKKPPLP